MGIEKSKKADYVDIGNSIELRANIKDGVEISYGISRKTDTFKDEEGCPYIYTLHRYENDKETHCQTIYCPMTGGYNSEWYKHGFSPTTWEWSLKPKTRDILLSYITTRILNYRNKTTIRKDEIETMKALKEHDIFIPLDSYDE